MKIILLEQISKQFRKSIIFHFDLWLEDYLFDSILDDLDTKISVTEIENKGL